ncbi:MAG: hypothetical protein AB202_02300 [Parcubacteria bacterium C7867-007]|nr:MAG: hypothetical protein AB202_02300 [Parcubacteria bacterium C7867-007]
MNIPTPGIYYHFKHPEQHYQVLGVAFHTETEEDMVVYKALYGEEKLYVRPLAMFLEYVEKPEFGYSGPRFVRIEATHG